MQGIYVNGERPPSKVAIKRHLLAQSNDGDGVTIEATSMFGNEYGGPLRDAPQGGETIYFVGPDPYTDRRFYGTLRYDGEKWVVK